MAKRIILIYIVTFSCAFLSAFEFYQKQQIHIGAIFFENEYMLERVFVDLISSINNESISNNFEIIPFIRRLDEKDDSIAQQREACDLIDEGVVAIFGPSSKAQSATALSHYHRTIYVGGVTSALNDTLPLVRILDIVALICNSTGILHFQFDSVIEDNQWSPSGARPNYQMTLNVYPSPFVLSKAYADIIESYGWKKFTLIYDADDYQASTRLQDLLQLKDLHNDVVRVRKYRRQDDYRIMWKSIKGERRVVLDAQPDLLVELLNESIPFDLTGQFNHLFLTNLETHCSNLRELRDNVTFAVNITAARLELNPDLPNDCERGKALHNFDSSELSWSDGSSRILVPDMIHDALQVFAQTIRNLSEMMSPYKFGEYFHKPIAKCDFSEFGNPKQWSLGPELVQMIKTTPSIVNSTRIRSKDLQFDENGERVSFKIEIFEPLDDYPIASWDPKGQITPHHMTANVTKKMVYRVATRIGEPYFMEKPEAVAQNITGNDRYEGYAVDLIKLISEQMGGIEYVFLPVPDNAYGKYNKNTKLWDGIIGELTNNDAHLGICDLTITQARKTVVDFTVPFMQLGISILAYKSPYEPKKVFAFLDCFGPMVWFTVAIAIFLMSFLVVILSRVSVSEWENPHPCNKDPDVLENKWNLSNAFYLSMASITTAGSDILPIGSPLRIFAASLWIFAIIIANSYTANLAAFLTNSKMEGTITDLKDLASQTKVKFGTIEGGSTYNFFSESNETVYRLAFNLMHNDDPSAYTKDNNAGVERVRRNFGNYMFLMETTSLEYNTERNCDLRAVGEKFGEKHYAIAVPFGAEYRRNFSVAILRLSEKGELFKLKNKWWKNHNVSCHVKANAEGTPDLNFEEVRGIFYTLYAGVFLAYILGVTEFLVNTHRIAVDEKMSFKEAFVKEIKFVFSIWNNEKPISSATPSASLRSSSQRSSEKTTSKSTAKMLLRKASFEMHDMQISDKTDKAH